METSRVLSVSCLPDTSGLTRMDGRNYRQLDVDDFDSFAILTLPCLWLMFGLFAMGGAIDCLFLCACMQTY